MALEEQLRLLAVEYNRYPVEDTGKFGFADRGRYPLRMFHTPEEAIAEEARDIRQRIVDEQVEINRLQRIIHTRLVHLGVLEK